MKTMDNYTKAEMMIRKPAAEVFMAFIDPAVTSQFWFTHSSGKLEEGKTVQWTWEMYGVTIPVRVVKIEPQKSILIEWGEGKDKSTVRWEFRQLSVDKTFVTITNSDLQGQGNELADQIRNSTGGFTLMIAALKAWLEHRIHLNLVADKFPRELLDS